MQRGDEGGPDLHGAEGHRPGHRGLGGRLGEADQGHAAPQAMTMAAIDQASGTSAPPQAAQRPRPSSSAPSGNHSERGRPRHRRPSSRKSRRRSAARSSPSGTRSTSSRATSRSSRKRCAADAGPPPGTFTGEYRPRGRERAARARPEPSDNGKPYRLNFAQVIGDMDWDLERIMMNLGTSSKFAAPSIVTFRSDLERQELLRSMDAVIDRRFRVYYDHQKATFSARTPSGAAHRSCPRKAGGSKPRPRGLARSAPLPQHSLARARLVGATPS